MVKIAIFFSYSYFIITLIFENSYVLDIRIPTYEEIEQMNDEEKEQELKIQVETMRKENSYQNKEIYDKHSWKRYYRLRKLINVIKGHILETDCRKIFRKEYQYNIIDSGKNWNINESEISKLLKEICLQL